MQPEIQHREPGVHSKRWVGSNAQSVSERTFDLSPKNNGESCSLGRGEHEQQQYDNGTEQKSGRSGHGSALLNFRRKSGIVKLLGFSFVLIFCHPVRIAACFGVISLQHCDCHSSYAVCSGGLADLLE